MFQESCFSISRSLLALCVMALSATHTVLFAQEYPVPRLSPAPVHVSGLEESLIDLNGTWAFSSGPDEAFFAQKPPPTGDLASIEVPGQWVMQGFEVEAGTAAGYRREFHIPSEWAEHRIKLRCDAIYSDATVYVNGQEIGRHVGGFTPFELDITDAAKPGAANTIAIAVRAESDSDLLSHGSEYAFHSLGGILRKLYVFALPNTNIASFHASTELDDDYQDAILKIDLQIANEANAVVNDLVASLELTAPDGAVVGLNQNDHELAAIQAGQTGQTTIELPVQNPAKWDCEHPNLYTLTCKLQQGGNSLQTVRRKIGFREVEVRGPEILVNGRPVKLRGVNRHEAHPLRGRSLTPELCRKDAELYKNANINYVRTAHYPASEEFIDACDEIGLFVGEEAPYCFMGMTWGNELWKTEDAHDPKYRDLIVRQTLEMIERDRSHPSIIIWSLGNESLWGPSFEASAEASAKLDPTRPLTFSFLPWELAWRQPDEPYCAIGADHYPGMGGPAKFAEYHRPILFDEYCHLNSYSQHEINADPGVREEWLAPFEEMWEAMYAARAVGGGALWSGVSDWFMLPGGKTVGCGHWGPIDGWRRPKQEYWHVKKVYSPVKLLDLTVEPPDDSEPTRLRVENRHDFTNLNELRITWGDADQSGEIRAAIPPRSEGVLEIPTQARDGDTLRIEFHDGKGRLVDVYEVAVQVKEPGQEPDSIVQAQDKIEFDQTPESYIIKGDGFEWQIDRETAQIVSGKRNGHVVISGGPILMTLPQAFDPKHEAYVVNGLLTGTCHDREVEEVAPQVRDDHVSIQVKDKYREARGGYTLKIDSTGHLSIYYFYRYEEELTARQIGMVFDVPAALNTLHWKRDAHWTVYPEHHIGRPIGQANAFYEPSAKADPRVPPIWPRSLDSNRMGTIDFRSTRTNVHYAALSNEQGAGIKVNGQGRQATRCWVDGDRIRLLVAGHSRGSGEPYLNKWGRHFEDVHRHLVKDSVLEDTIRLEWSDD